VCGESEENLELISLIDEQYLKTPFYGSPRLTAMLRRMGYRVNHKRVERLMRLTGIGIVYLKKNIRGPHIKMAFLLKDAEINTLYGKELWGGFFLLLLLLL
jgi:putative transposase